ncbi:MAG: VOC family protein [Streptosporangiaceae bacterium]
MPTRLVHLVIDAADPGRLARFWAEALGWEVGAEVERLRALGATPVDVGQGDVPWAVLADPEGSEFCVLSPRGSLR